MRGRIVLAALLCMGVAPSATDQAVLKVAEEWKATRRTLQPLRPCTRRMRTYVSAHVVADGRPEIQAYFQRGIDAGGHIDSIQILASSQSGELAYTVGT